MKQSLESIAKILYRKGIPIIPIRGKRPIIKGWSIYGERSMTLSEFKQILKIIKEKASGIGIPLGKASGLIAVDIDTDDPILLNKMLQVLPKTIIKKGKKGFTAFYQYNGEVSLKIKFKGIPIIEILSTGNQTVIPPSIHPETGKPYYYESDFDLIDAEIKQLPFFAPNILDELKGLVPQDSLDYHIEILSGGRNDALKRIVSAKLNSGINLQSILEDIVAYDLENHSPPLFSDRSEGMNADPFTNAACFVSNIMRSIAQKRNQANEEPLYTLSLPNSKGIECLSLKDFCEEGRFKEPTPLIYKLLNESEFHILSATAKTGKSNLAIALAIAVAQGSPFLNQFVSKKSIVLIWQTEIANIHFKSRIEKIAGKELGELGESIYIASERIKLDTPEGLKALKDVILKKNPKLMILDPFYTLHNKEEDKSSDIAPILSDLRKIVHETGTACLLIHHQGKGVSSNAQVGHRHRGSSSFADVPDGSWSLVRTDDGNAKLSFELRNDHSPAPIKLSLNENNLRWQNLGSAQQNKIFTIDNLVKIIEENPRVSATELKEIIRSSFDVSIRKIETILKKAQIQDLIICTQTGRTRTYSSCAQNHAPREKCVADIDDFLQ